MIKSKIFITGGTGKQGGAVARTLLTKGYHIKILTRNPDSAGARELLDKGAEIIKGSFEDTTLIKYNLQDVSSLFLMSTAYETGVKQEVTDAKAVIDMAVNADVEFILFTSVADAHRQTGIPHFDSKYEIEQYLSSKSIASAVIAPVYFYDNFFAPFVLPGLKNGVFAQAMPADKILQSIAVQTIGDFAAHILENPLVFSGKRINIAADELTGPQYATILSRKSGIPIVYKELPIDVVRQNSEDMAKMYEWFKNTGYSVNIKSLKKEYPQIKWLSFKDWAAAQDWSVLKEPAVSLH